MDKKGVVRGRGRREGERREGERQYKEIEKK